MSKISRILALTAVVLASFFSLQTVSAASDTTLTFSNSGIVETISSSGYTIDGTNLTITAPGTYRLVGTCDSGSITIGKDLDVKLIFESFKLGSSSGINTLGGGKITLMGSLKLTSSADGISAETSDLKLDGLTLDLQTSGRGIVGKSLAILDSNIYINSGASGLKSSGDITISGQNSEIWGSAPVEYSGTLSVKDATVFAGGTAGTQPLHNNLSTTQKYLQSTLSYPSGQKVYVASSHGSIYNTITPRAANYLFFTSPSVTTDYSFSTAGSTTPSTQLVTDGIYTIHSAMNSGKVLDVAGGSLADSANIQLYDGNGTAAQKYLIRHIEDNIYEIENLYSEKLLDVAAGSLEKGANVQQHTGNGTCAQRWTIMKTADNYYSFISTCSGLYLDIASANTSNGANVQLYASNDSSAQKFSLQTVVEIPKTQPVDNGTYVVKSALDSGKVIDVASGSKSDGANVQLYASNGTPAQTFTLTYLKDGFYQITNANSGKALDVDGGKTISGANVQQYTGNGTIAQQWLIVKTADGYYSFFSRCNGLYLDIAGGSTFDGANIQLYTGNDSKAQKFTFGK